MTIIRPSSNYGVNYDPHRPPLWVRIIYVLFVILVLLSAVTGAFGIFFTLIAAAIVAGLIKRAIDHRKRYH